MPNTKKVKIAGKEYTIQPLPLRQARAMRERFTGKIGELSSAIGTLQNVDVADLQGMSCLIQQIGGMVAGSVDTLAEWLFEYSPALAADRERIEAEAFDDEIVAAFWVMLEQLYPFGGLMTRVRGLQKQAT